MKGNIHLFQSCLKHHLCLYGVVAAFPICPVLPNSLDKPVNFVVGNTCIGRSARYYPSSGNHYFCRNVFVGVCRDDILAVCGI